MRKPANNLGRIHVCVCACAKSGWGRSNTLFLAFQPHALNTCIKILRRLILNLQGSSLSIDRMSKTKKNKKNLPITFLRSRCNN